uniref:Uncharacterized protein n=1 Tax=Lotharella globosa TaxID=91324 RepID=A0A7S3YC06_9EUKA
MMSAMPDMSSTPPNHRTKKESGYFSGICFGMIRMIRMLCDVLLVVLAGNYHYFSWCAHPFSFVLAMVLLFCPYCFERRSSIYARATKGVLNIVNSSSLLSAQ